MTSGDVRAQNTLPPGQDPARNMASAGYLGLWAEASESPASVTLRFLYTKNSNNQAYPLEIRRRIYSPAGNQAWELVGQAPADATSWTDASVSPGIAYEYLASSVGVSPQLVGVVAAGVRVNQSVQRGTIIVVLAENIVGENVAAISQLYQDLIGDNWKVRTIVTPMFDDFPETASEWRTVRGVLSRKYPSKLRDEIRSIYYEDPENTNLLYFLGHVPIAMTGTSVSHSDGHGSRPMYAADHFYADMDGVWLDALFNRYATSVEIRGARNLPNFPRDGAFDHNLMVSSVEMGFGRVDPWNPGTTDWYSPELTQSQKIARYLSKANQFRHVEPFGPTGSESLAGRKAFMRWTSGGQDGAASYAASFLSMVGPHNMDNWRALSAMPAPVTPVTDEDVQWTITNGPYLFYGQGSQPPPDSGGDALSKAVNWSSMQSFFGDWFASSEMQRHIMNDNMALTWLYTGRFVPELFNHGLGVADAIGNTMRLSTNLPSNQAYLSLNPGSRNFNRVLMGDPALRMFPVSPVRNFTVQRVGSTVSLNWQPPAQLAEFQFYEVWRAPELTGQFEKLATQITSTQFSDPTPLPGTNVYKVQAVHRVVTGSGTVLTNSQGMFGSLGITIDPLVLPPFEAGSDVNHTLTATGVQGSAQWSVKSGKLPAGLTLSSNGTLSGRPVIPGNYRVIFGVSDSSGSATMRELVVYVDLTQTEVLHLDLDSIRGQGLTDRVFSSRIITPRGGVTANAEEGMDFDGVDDAIIVSYMGESAPVANAWQSIQMFPPSARPSFSLEFKVPPTSAGGVLLSRSTDLSSTFAVNQNVYTIRMLPDGRLQAWTRNFSPLTTTASFKDNQWHHAVFTYNPITRQTAFYVNGILVGTQGEGGKTVNERTVLGARWNGPGETTTTDHFQGAMRDVRTYSYSLTANEVRALHEARSRLRPELNPAPPRLSAMPGRLVLVSTGGMQITNFRVDTTYGEVPEFRVVASNPAAFQALYITRTAEGYRLHAHPAAGFIGNVSITINIEDGWPRNQSSVTIPVTVQAGLDYATWMATVDWEGADSSAAADANGNGLANLEEFFFGQDPVVTTGATSQPVTITSLANTPRGERLVVQFPRRKGISRVAYRIQTSPDLSVWTTERNLFETVESSGSTDSVDLVEVAIPSDVRKNRKFVRIQTELLP